MFDKLTLLGIAVSGMENTAEQAVEENNENAAFWIVILLAVIIICIILGKYLPEVIQSVKDRKKANVQKKDEDRRSEELERLHRIKEKNKRK